MWRIVRADPKKPLISIKLYQQPESEHSPPPSTVKGRPRMRFDRNELAGAFGDIGTDLPLIIGMILAAGLDSASVLIMFGLMQVFTALTYGIPMAVQPLKAVAVIVITQQVAPEILYGEGSQSVLRCCF